MLMKRERNNRYINREIHTIDVDVFERKYAKKIFSGMK